MTQWCNLPLWKPQYHVEPQTRGSLERKLRGLCQCLVSFNVDTYRLGKNCAERAQTSRTPMSSYQDYASRRPQEPWKYLDIYFAPPLVCSAIQSIIFCGWETRFQVARGRTLKGWSLASSFSFFLYINCVTRFQPFSRSKEQLHPNTADSSSWSLHLCHVQ